MKRIDWREFWEYLLENASWIVTVGVFLTVAALIAAFIADSAPRLTVGIVIDKDYQPAYTGTSTSVTNGENGTTVRSHPVHHDARCRVQVSGVDAEGEAVAEWWSVGEGLYSLIQIGDMVQRDPSTGAITIKQAAR